jgi:hypothetical protein
MHGFRYQYPSLSIAIFRRGRPSVLDDTQVPVPILKHRRKSVFGEWYTVGGFDFNKLRKNAGFRKKLSRIPWIFPRLANAYL